MNGLSLMQFFFDEIGLSLCKFKTDHFVNMGLISKISSDFNQFLTKWCLIFLSFSELLISQT
jgi:hypothetical protein